MAFAADEATTVVDLALFAYLNGRENQNYWRTARTFNSQTDGRRMTFSASKTAPPHVGQASPSSPLQNEHLQTLSSSWSSSSFNDIITMIKLYGGRIRKECRWGRLDSGCMAGPEKNRFQQTQTLRDPSDKTIANSSSNLQCGSPLCMWALPGAKSFPHEQHLWQALW